MNCLCLQQHLHSLQLGFDEDLEHSLSLCLYLALSTAVCVVTMDTVLEQQRRLHEERERVEDALMKEMILKKNGVRTSDV